MAANYQNTFDINKARSVTNRTDYTRNSSSKNSYYNDNTDILKRVENNVNNYLVNKKLSIKNN